MPSIVFGALNFTLLIPLFDTLFGVNQPPSAGLVMPAFKLSAEYLKQLFNYYSVSIISEHGKVAALFITCSIILFSVFLANAFKYLSQRVLTRMRTWLVFKLKKALYQKISTLHLGYFHRQQKGNLLSIMASDVHEIENSVVSSIQVLFRDPLQVVVYFTLLFILSAELTLFTIIFFPVSAYIIASISKKLRHSSNISQAVLGKMLSVLEETISGIRIIKAFLAQKIMQSKFEQYNDEYRKVTKSMVNRRELAGPLSEFLGTLVVLGVLVYGGRLVLMGQSTLTASVFVAYIAIYSQIIPPIKNISSAITNLQRGLASGARVLGVIDVPEEVVDEPQAVELVDFKAEVEFQNMSFAYQEEEVLKNISFKIPKGKMVALVGQSGSGKSTLADLLARFYDPLSGGIYIDGINLKKYKLASLRSHMGIVTQEPILFNDTVFNNIAFGMPDATMESVQRAAEIANAHGFIMAMEEGYQTNIGDRGSRLSGGQRQRLSIARAVLKNPSILILDEATSSLDTESEKLVQEAIDKLMANRTSLIIAHRLSTIQHADEIIVLMNGEIVEKGTHAGLYKQHGVYRGLCDLQSFE